MDDKIKARLEALQNDLLNSEGIVVRFSQKVLMLRGAILELTELLKPEEKKDGVE